MKSAARRVVVITVIVAVALTMGALALRLRRADDLARLRAMPTPARPLEARLWGFRYAARDSVARGPAGAISPATLKLREAAEELRSAAVDGRTRAVSMLLTEQWDGAARLLEHEAKVGSRDPGLWNDLAVARYQLARRDGDRHASTLALAAADRAIALEGRAAEPHFNRALILEDLGLLAPASLAWKSAAAFDAATPWAAEEQEHVRRLGRPTRTLQWKRDVVELERLAVAGDEPGVRMIVVTYPEQARTWGEGPYLAQWAEAYEARDFEKAAAQLSIARAIGIALAASNGEQLLRDAVAAIDRSAGDRQRLGALATAHLDYRRARLLYRDRDIAAAEVLFDAAASLFSRAGSPMALLCAYYRTSALADRNEERRARSEAQALLARTPASYAALQSQLWWNLGTFATNDGRSDEALTAYSHAVELFDRLGESDHAMQMRGVLAVNLSILGNESEAWQIRSEIFAAASRNGDPSVLQFALTGAFESEAVAAHWDAVRALATVAERVPGSNPRLRVAALIARTYADLSLADAAFAGDFATARRAVAALPDRDHREEAFDELRFVDALARMPADPAGARRLLDATIAFEETRRRAIDLPASFAARARACRAMGDDTAAVADLSSAVRLIEERRSAIGSAELRDSFFGTGEQTFRELIALLLSRGERERAFEVAERARARVMIESTTADPDAEPLGAAAIRAALPAGLALVHYVALDDRLVAFVVTREALRVRVSPVAREALRAESDGLIAASGGTRDTVLRAKESALFRHLIAPIEDDLGTVQSLVVVTDDATAGVPFASLWDAAHGRYTIERMPVVVAPSASAFVLRSRDTAPPPERVVAVGDPAFDAAAFPHLERLASAHEECVEISRTYPSSVVLTDTAATTAHVLGAIAGGDVVHIGAHAVVNRRNPMLSAILLAPSDGDSGRLLLRQIAEVKLSRHPVVVLAGCETGKRGAGFGELRSLASAFLLAGSRSVIGTLWPVEDRASREFSRRLHRQLRSGVAPSRALQRVQLELMHDPDPQLSSPSTWAAFQLFGI